ncbi:MAG: hypothetical protein ACK56K_09730 [Akkermansiaceae bacterium]
MALIISKLMNFLGSLVGGGGGNMIGSGGGGGGGGRCGGSARAVPAGKAIRGPSGKVSSQKYLKNNWDKGTFGSVEKSIKYHVAKHGKGLSPERYTQKAMKCFKDKEATRTNSIDKQHRDVIKVKGVDGIGLFTPKGKIIWFHPSGK